MFRVCLVFLSVQCSLVVTCWERADLLHVICYCVFVTFPCGVPVQVWCLIVLIPDFCILSYFFYKYKSYAQNDLCNQSRLVRAFAVKQ